MKKYLVSLPSFPNDKTWNTRTILVKAKNETDALALVRHLKPCDNIGLIKEVDY